MDSNPHERRTAAEPRHGRARHGNHTAGRVRKAGGGRGGCRLLGVASRKLHHRSHIAGRWRIPGPADKSAGRGRDRMSLGSYEATWPVRSLILYRLVTIDLLGRLV